MECKLESITVHYETLGEGRPIVMLHGWSLDHHHMMNTMEPLFGQREGWRRIYPDLPGHGKTAGPDWITDQDRMLDAVLDFVDAVAPGQRFAVVGTSAGAYLARGVAYRRAASLDGLLMVVPLIVADDDKRTLPAHAILVEDPALTADLTPNEAGAFQLAVVQSRQVLNWLRADPALTVGVGDQNFMARIRQNPKRYGFSFDVDALPEPFPGPTLVLAGRQDASVGYRDAWEILENYPRGTFAVLDRAGHLLEVEQQALFRALVGEWLDRVEEYARGIGRTA